MFKSLGFVVGLCVALVLTMILLKLANTDRRARTQYDERQALIRGRGYRFSFFAMLIYEVVMLGLELGEVALPFERYLLHFGAIAVGALTLASYCIWKDCYWGINNNRTRYIAVFAAVVLLNAIPVVSGIMGGSPWQDYSINIVCMIMLLVLVVELAVKAIADRREEDV